MWCVSPRNYFLFTPLLPSAAVGTLEGRSVVDSVRRLFDNSVTFVESTCTAIDPLAKTITCQPEAAASSLSASLLGAANPEPNAGSSSRVVVDSTRTRPTLDIQYDKLVVAVSMTPGYRPLSAHLSPSCRQAIDSGSPCGHHPR